MEEAFSDKAIRLVDNYLAGLNRDTSNIKIVWFCKTLQNWKAMVADLSENGMFFEVTYNGNKQETYIDAYEKFENVKVVD